MKKFLIPIFAGLLFLTSCEDGSDGLGSEDIVNGLKTALEVGTDSTVSRVSKAGGYFKDEAIKILLPEEAQQVVNLINNNAAVRTIANGLGFDNIVNETIQSLNNAAEEAANSATPIFKSAITGLSITDGLSILQGKNPAGTIKSTAEFDSTAATAYLKSTTYAQLVSAYAPPVNTALSKVGTTQVWETFTGMCNTIANNSVVKLLGLNIKPINTNLGEYVTEKALNGLFLKVGGVEKDIRKDPLAWAKDTGKEILSKVFGAIGL